jgi:hypothetical protein
VSATLRSRLQSAKVVFALLAVIVVPTVVTLYRVQQGLDPMDLKRYDNPTPLGYTVSLLIYLVPVVAIYLWFRRRYQEGSGVDYRRGAYRWTLWSLIPLGYLLDIVFGYPFLEFKNANAVLKIPRVPALSYDAQWFVKHLPIEEFVFYTLGFMVILSTYIWCDEYWLSRYNVPDYEQPPADGGRGLPERIVQLNFVEPIAISVTLIALAIAYKWYGPHPYHHGFPSYFTFLVLASLFPSVLFFRTTQRFVNWPAVSFTLLCVTLTSLIWEATLAIPYGWWGYKEQHMMGLFILGWHKLPIEAALLWVSVTFTTVIVYETLKIFIAMKTQIKSGWRAALFGDAPDRSQSINA